MTALIQYELSSNCTCETTDENDNTITDFCFGCYTDDFANLKYSIIEPWLTANGLSKPDQVLISVEREELSCTHSRDSPHEAAS